MVEEVLKTGQRNALSPEYLAKRLNLGTVRALQKQVEKLVSAEQLQYMVMRMTNLITICYRICRLVS